MSLTDVVGRGLLVFTPQPNHFVSSESATEIERLTDDESKVAPGITRIDEDPANLLVSQLSLVDFPQIGVNVVWPFQHDPQLLVPPHSSNRFHDRQSKQILHEYDSRRFSHRESQDERELQATRRRDPRVPSTPTSSDLMRSEADETSRQSGEQSVISGATRIINTRRSDVERSDSLVQHRLRTRHSLSVQQNVAKRSGRITDRSQLSKVGGDVEEGSETGRGQPFDAGDDVLRREL